MKIHIVQKGDTLWGIAQNYEVDFEELKELNSHLSSPDMIMPGMKIRIPSSYKVVKKNIQSKEMKKNDSTPSLKPIEQVMEDDKEAPKEMKVKMPQIPNMSQMPVLGMEMKDEEMKDLYTPPKKMKEMPKPKPMMEQPMDFGQHQSMPPFGYHPMPVMPVHNHGACHCCGAQLKQHPGSTMCQMKEHTSPNHMLMHQPMVDHKHNKWQNHSNHMRTTPPVGSIHPNNMLYPATNKYQENLVHPASNYQYNDLQQSTPYVPEFPTFED